MTVVVRDQTNSRQLTQNKRRKCNEWELFLLKRKMSTGGIIIPLPRAQLLQRGKSSLLLTEWWFLLIPSLSSHLPLNTQSPLTITRAFCYTQSHLSSTLHTPIHTSSPIGCVLISFMILSFLWIKFCALAIRLGWRHQTWDTAWDLHCHTARSNI